EIPAKVYKVEKAMYGLHQAPRAWYGTLSNYLLTNGFQRIDIQMARQLEEEMERDAQRMNEQIARDAKIARIHAEEELQIMIDGSDRSNETVAKYLKPYTKKQKRDYYMAVNKSNLGWKVKDFRGMTFKEIEAKFTTVWKQIENFIPMGLKVEAERFKRKRIRFEQESVKKLKTSKEVLEEVKSPDEVPKEKVKEMMQLVPIEELYVEALKVKHLIIVWKVHNEEQRSYWKITRLGGSSSRYQFFVDMLKHLDREDLNQLWVLVKESLNNRPPTSNKEMELWVELKRLYEPDNKYQLWTHTQNLMHASVEWKLYDTCGVHHVTSKDKEIFMFVEKDYPLRKGLAIGMISYKLQICFWIIDSGCSKHMTGNHALLTNFVEKFLGMVHFGNNDFAVIAGYGDVVIGSMTIKKVY
nr:putative ribonuclease H-like domain-containing protein [Tanacetum cinerariifolium]